MRTVKKTVTTNSQSLFELGGFNDANCNGILIQAPMANTNYIYFGERGSEFHELLNGGSSGLDGNSLKNIFIKGTAPDMVIISAL